MEHSFNVEIATKYGVPCAVILNNIAFWIEKNKANNKHFHEGKYWTYNSNVAFENLFPYLTSKQIRTALDKLRGEGLIETNNFNKVGYDRTLWYTITEQGYETLGITDLPHKANGFALQGEPIPYINTDTKTNNRGTANNRFVPPTVEEVDEYIKEKQFHFQANEFVDYYESKGWLVGKTKMKNWKAACRTFEANELKWHPELKDMPPTKNFTGEYGGHSYYEGERLD